MVYKVGQGIWGRICFKDGNFPEYDRPYLIVSVGEDFIGVLNVSSIQGKERKIAFKTNFKLNSYNPPFKKPSFVKLDSFTKVPIKECTKLSLLSNGEVLSEEEITKIIAKLNF